MTFDLVVVGAGVMGLLTALHASRFTPRVAVLERFEIGHPLAASSGKTRSIRNDYLDPFYARLAFEARGLWEGLNREAEGELLIDCGVLNLAKAALTPDLEATYACQAHRNLSHLGIESRRYDRDGLRAAFPQFEADLGCLDVQAGMLNLPAVRRLALGRLSQRGVAVLEKVEVRRIGEGRLETSQGEITAGSVVITAGMWSNQALACCDRAIQLPLTLQRPDWAYFRPPAGKEQLYTSERMPVFAYLDLGIYGHPMHPGLTPGVKVGFYHPPDLRSDSRIEGPQDFIRECLPGFTEITVVEEEVQEGCSYDLVGDDNFVIGPVPGYERVFVGAGWRGTGYKFAPLIGKILAQLALQEGTVYDISRFTPARFVGGR